MTETKQVEKAGLIEVFSSIQGEGLFVGCRQVFVRLAGCNISCRYCDTRESFITPSLARIEAGPGCRNFFDAANPVPVSDLVAYVAALCQTPHHSISVTGGEPLLFPHVIVALSVLRDKGVRLYLETNGTLPAELQAVIDSLDIISLDFKLPSVLDGKEYWREHAEFLRIAATKIAFVKVVLTGETTQAEIERTIGLIAGVDSRIPLVFQPVTPINGVNCVESSKALLWQEQALLQLSDVRVIPQTHKIMGQL